MSKDSKSISCECYNVIICEYKKLYTMTITRFIDYQIVYCYKIMLMLQIYLKRRSRKLYKPNNFSPPFCCQAGNPCLYIFLIVYLSPYFGLCIHHGWLILHPDGGWFILDQSQLVWSKFSYNLNKSILQTFMDRHIRFRKFANFSGVNIKFGWYKIY